MESLSAIWKPVGEFLSEGKIVEPVACLLAVLVATIAFLYLRARHPRSTEPSPKISSVPRTNGTSNPNKDRQPGCM
jgi:hypothetical protein